MVGTGRTTADGTDESTVRSREVLVEGRRIHYLAAGTGDPTLVLLHGGRIDAARLSWYGHIRALATDATVVAPDLPGYGDSELPSAPLSQTFLTRTVSRFLDELGVDRAVVAGVSVGGGIGLGLALTEPDRVDRLVAIDAYGLGRELPNGRLSWLLSRIQVTNHLSVALGRRSRRLVEASLDSIAHDPSEIPPEVVDELMVEINRPNAGAAYRSWRSQEVTRSGFRTDFSERLADLSVPTRFVHGEYDEVFPVEWAHRAARRAPDAELSVLPDCGHWSTQEKAPHVGKLIREVL